MYLIVDGYNIIGAWPEFAGESDLAHSRDRLIHLLADYAGYTGHQLTVVFDGYGGSKKLATVEQVFGITVVYTRQHETADHYIERAVDLFLDGVPRYAHADVRVATNDALEPSVILSRGRCACRRRNCAATCSRQAQAPEGTGGAGADQALDL